MTQLDRDGTCSRAAAGLGRPDRKGVPAGDPGGDRAPAQQALRGRRPERLQRVADTLTTDLWHRFYQNQMQIDDGRNDKFVAWADCGAMVMGYFDGSKMQMWQIAKQYTLADNFFMGAFGGSFLNHTGWSAPARRPIRTPIRARPRADRRSRAGRRHTQGRRQLAQVGDGRHSEIRQQRQDHAGLLCHQYHAAALPAERQQAGSRRRPALRRPGSRTPCRRRPSPPSAICSAQKA